MERTQILMQLQSHNLTVKDKMEEKNKEAEKHTALLVAHNTAKKKLEASKIKEATTTAAPVKSGKKAKSAGKKLATKKKTANQE